MRTIKLANHDPAWEQAYRLEAAQVFHVLAPRVRGIHHIGSTAIDGIKAKPIIDLLVEVDDIQAVDAYQSLMQRCGYIPKGEYGMPGRRFFIKGDEEHHTHHIHVFQAGHPEIARHLDYRDYLQAHPDEAQAYSTLKEELACKFPHDIDAYTNGKTAFIKDIEQKAHAWEKQVNRQNLLCLQ
jgi:GrpB-like predicted nucleotidyltransferase (UPF0157 family)